MEQDTSGRPPLGAGPAGCAPSPPVSAVPALVPDAGQWAIVQAGVDLNYYIAVRIDAVTPKLIKSRTWGKSYAHHSRDNIVALFDDREAANQLIQAIDGVRGGFRDARWNENTRHREAMQRIAEKQARAVAKVISRALAQGMAREAPRPEGSGSSELPSPVGETDAPISEVNP